mmetsp:Transcript_41603/g.93421  ORF Transcript_41603/g.93421 Transcript_41603/m.93421 type:complete len:439 (+) Transcript_41603:145-1461(+)
MSEQERLETLAAEFGERLDSIDYSLRRGDYAACKQRYVQLKDFISRLSKADRRVLEQPGAVPRWSEERRTRLKRRWDACQNHGGMWSKWCAMLPPPVCWGVPAGGYDQDLLREGARDLVYVSSPEEHRRVVWQFCAGCGPADARSFKATVEALQGEGEDNGLVEQMWLDATRTPHLTHDEQVQLVRVLRVWSAQQHSRRRNKGAAIGKSGYYVQGMHMLVSCPLWAGLEEAEALQVFEYVVKNLAANYYGDEDFSAFQRDTIVLEELVKERLPQLAEAMQAAGLPTQLLAFDPLLCLFTLHAPREVALRLWDMLLIEGETAIFALLLVLLARLVPEVPAEVTKTDGTLLLADKLSRQLTDLSPQDVENVLKLTRTMLDGSGPGSCPPVDGSGVSAWEGTDIRQRVEELRREAERNLSGNKGLWWDDAVSRFRSLWFSG